MVASSRTRAAPFALALSAFATPAIVAGLAACSDSNDAETVVTTADAGGDATAPIDASSTGKESFTIFVTHAGIPNGAAPPLADATVIVDKPGGERVEARSGADGLVTIQDVDWSLGSAAVTAFGQGTTLVSFVELTKAELARVARPAFPGEPKRDFTAAVFDDEQLFPKVSGKVTHPKGAYCVLGATTLGTIHQGNAPGNYSFRVKPGSAFSFVALDLHFLGAPSVGPRGREYGFDRWVEFTQSPITADTTVNLDFDAMTPMAVQKTKGRIVIAGGKVGPLGGSSTPSIGVSSIDSHASAFLGAAAKADVTATGDAFDFELEYVKPTGAVPVARYTIELPDGSASTVSVLDWPKDGESIDGFVYPPVVVETTRSFADAFTIEGVAPTASTRVVALDGKDNTRWSIEVPPGVKSFVPPVLTDGAAVVVGPTPKGVVVALDGFDPTTAYFRLSAASRRFELK